MPRQPRVLIIEDDHVFADTLTAVLRASETAEVRTLHPGCTSEETLGLARQWRADVVVLEVDLHQRWSGATLAEALELCGTRVILASATASLDLPAACTAEVDDTAQPWADLVRMIERVTRRPTLRATAR